ncbi:MFS transporter [Mycobacterium sp. AT1]|uniref:MFS transporter n=1 Tax=Mycobacterium sp. AT1 TaxID=1961706 RepID=UPI001301E518|nr:MFS transporter [Mycobacterium sp. AT1]
MSAVLVVFVVLRIPLAAAPLLLTLHVALELDLGFAKSGLVAAAMAAGTAIGAPLAGTAVDRFGLRAVMVVTTAAEALFWGTAQHVPYPVLPPLALVGGLLAIPAFSLSRQCLAAMLPASELQTGYALDSMMFEIAYAIGPPIAVLLFTTVGREVAFPAVTVIMLLGGVALTVLNPPVRPPRTDPEVWTKTDGRWWTRHTVGLMIVTTGATLALLGMDAAITAQLRDLDQTRMLSVVIAVSCAASLAGGFVYGLLSKPIAPWLLLVVMSAAVALIACAHSWIVIVVLAIPSAACCAPLLAAAAEALSRQVPDGVRGRAMGLQSSSLTLGGGAGAALAGVVVDRWSPNMGLLVVGGVGVALGLLGALFTRSAPAGLDDSPSGLGLT